MPTPKFPKTIHVTRHPDGPDDTYLSVHEDGLPVVSETTVVAVYQLVSVGQVEVTRKFVEKKAR